MTGFYIISMGDGLNITSKDNGFNYTAMDQGWNYSAEIYTQHCHGLSSKNAELKFKRPCNGLSTGGESKDFGGSIDIYAGWNLSKLFCRGCS